MGWGQALSEHEGFRLAGLLGRFRGGRGSLGGDGHVAVWEWITANAQASRANVSRTAGTELCPLQ